MIALDAALTATGRQPILDLLASGTLQARAARRRGRRRGDRQGPRRGVEARRADAGRAAPLAAVGDAAPGGLGRQLDRLAAAADRGSRAARRRSCRSRSSKPTLELALVDALVEPGAAEHEPAQPVHQRALGRADQLRPAVVDVLAQAEAGSRISPLTARLTRSSSSSSPRRPPTKPSFSAACSQRSAKSTSLNVKRSSPYSRTKSSPES